ncbi:hypothetical protein HDU87_003675 [Geranomyces variabilis]|uniref:Amino acid transporter transmembrane domain-containing protein n=1 Tax=Geranomyces variabilis TaxID=109894 RepID=A0AAD5XN02_9FUNG|nr:hypothetical protein HDU87_003675 [Geranomyces variabilis]
MSNRTTRSPPPHALRDDDDDNDSFTTFFVHSVDEDEEEEDAEDADENLVDENEGLMPATDFRRRQRGRESRSSHATDSYVSRSTAALESWVSSYARSSMFLADTAMPSPAFLSVDADGDLEGTMSDTPILDVMAPFADEDSEGYIGHVAAFAPGYGTLDSGSEEKPEAKNTQVEHHVLHHASTFAQTCFNACNVLMGIGILSLPFAFSITGWFVGGLLLLACSAMTRHTAGLLALCLDYTPMTAADRPALQPLLSAAVSAISRRAMTFGDIGELAFGTRGRNLISLIFCFELLASCTALVILISDSVTALAPSWNHVLVKSVAVCAMIPVTWPTSLKWASYGSLIGIVALVNLIVIILYDGLTTTETPGSLINRAETHFWPENWFDIPLAIGLIMAGFCGHSVFPNIHRDMAQPAKYTSMLNTSYSITSFVYVAIAAAGYAMFGSSTMPEITQNLPLVPSYNAFLTHTTLLLLTVNPATKFPLNVNPINVQLEHTLHLISPRTVYPLPLANRIMLRTCTALFVLFISIIFPDFSQLMSLMGSLFAFSVCIVFPCLAYLTLYRRRLSRARYAAEVAVLCCGAALGVTGTIWAIFFAT